MKRGHALGTRGDKSLIALRQSVTRREVILDAKHGGNAEKAKN